MSMNRDGALARLGCGRRRDPETRSQARVEGRVRGTTQILVTEATPRQAQEWSGRSAPLSKSSVDHLHVTGQGSGAARY